jgi:acetolactate synthase regulatory subunit
VLQQTSPSLPSPSPSSGGPGLVGVDRPDRLFEIELTSSPTALLCVLNTVRQRQCDVLRVEFAGEADRRGRLRLVLRPPSVRAGSLTAWIERLIDVVDVREIPSEGIPTWPKSSSSSSSSSASAGS